MMCGCYGSPFPPAETRFKCYWCRRLIAPKSNRSVPDSDSSGSGSQDLLRSSKNLSTVLSVLGCRRVGACPGLGVGDNVRSRAVDNRFQFSLLLGGNREVIQRLLKII